NIDLVQLRFPQAELVADIQAEAPLLRYEHVGGRSFGKGSLAPVIAGETARNASNLAVDVWNDIRARIAGKSGKYLVVTHKDVALDWQTVVMPQIEIAWFGNLRGLDAYREVAGIFIVGRWGLTPNKAGEIAALLTGRAVDRLEGWYPKSATTLRARDGSAMTI